MSDNTEGRKILAGMPTSSNIYTSGGFSGLPMLLPFPELHEHRVYVLKGSVYLLPHLGSGEDDLARDEGEDNDLGVCHAVDQPREDLRLILSSIRRVTGK